MTKYSSDYVQSAAKCQFCVASAWNFNRIQLSPDVIIPVSSIANLLARGVASFMFFFDWKPMKVLRLFCTYGWYRW